MTSIVDSMKGVSSSCFAGQVRSGQVRLVSVVVDVAGVVDSGVACVVKEQGLGYKSRTEFHPLSFATRGSSGVPKQLCKKTESRTFRSSGKTRRAKDVFMCMCMRRWESEVRSIRQTTPSNGFGAL